MDNIKIQRLTDSHAEPCGRCGDYASAFGYRVAHNDNLMFELTPHSGCCGGTTYTTSDLISEILKHYGHEARVTFEIYGE